MLENDKMSNTASPVQKASLAIELIEFRPQQIADFLKSFVGIGSLPHQTQDIRVKPSRRGAEEAQEFAVQVRVVSRANFLAAVLLTNHDIQELVSAPSTKGRWLIAEWEFATEK